MERRSFLSLVAGGAAVVTLAGCGGDAGTGTGGAGAPKELVLGILAEPASWDPAQTHVGHLLQPQQLAYDSLILRKADGTYAPMLAASWKYTDDTKMVLEMKLRTDVTFSDGEKFDGNAVKANLDHFKKDNGRQVAQLAAYDSTTVVDASTVQIKLKETDPAFEYYMSQAAGLMGSPKALENPDIDQIPVGSGPYVMVKDQSVKGSQYVFTKREGYWNKDLQKWDKVTLKFLSDITARANALTSGQIDATLLDPSTSAQAEGAGKKLLAWPVDWSGLLIFDRDGKIVPALKEVKVRQAINHALDRASLLKNVMNGGGTITSQVFGPESGSYVKELDGFYSFDPAKAKSLLAEAGYAQGFEMKMPLLPGTDVVNNYVKQMLGDVGIKVTLEPVPAADYQGLIGKGQYPVAWFNLFQGVTWVACGQIIVPNTLYNPFKTTNPEIAKLLDETRVAGAQAGEKGKAVNKYVTENAWFAPFYRINQMYLYDDKKVKVTPQVQMAVPTIYNYEPVA
jgi:peptide/nickel transport system substrate-binding protein